MPVTGLPLPLHVPLHRLPVRSLPHCGHIVPISPKLSTPQLPFDGWLPSKDLPGRDALEHLDNPSQRHFRMGTAEEMDMILVLVRPDCFYLDWKSLRNLGRRLPDYRCHPVIQQHLAIFHRKHNVVMDFRCTVRL